MINRQRTDGDLATLLSALSMATDMGFGGHVEHGIRTAYLGMQLADALQLNLGEHEAIFYSALLKDVACTACAAGIAAFFPDDEQVSLSQVILVDPSSFSDMIGWLSRYVPLDARFPTRIAKLLSFMVQCGPIVKETMRSHCEVAELFARQLGFSETVCQALRFQWERWDGKGMAYGLKGSAVPITSRILHAAQVIELTYHFSGVAAMQRFLEEKRGKRFDPMVVDAFLTLSRSEHFWEDFDQLTLEAIMAARPVTPVEWVWQDQDERICETLADFVDIKVRENWHHSRRVAEAAVGIGTVLGLGAQELGRLRCAALVHDVGKVAIPVALLAKGEQRSSSEWETYRLHPYYTQRILEQVTSLRDLAQVAASHHEWIDGQGYHRRLTGEQIPLHGRILAVANSYVRLAQQYEGQSSDPSAVLQQMLPLVGTQFDSTCYEALKRSLMGGATSASSKKKVRSISQKADALTERERQVLALLAQGHNTPQIAHMLTISKKTVEHHLAHIYNKIGVTCRTAAVAYAVQHDLV